jgi:Family of unknown function (DUF6152)
MTRYLVVLLAAAAGLVGARAYAHHSFAATYHEDQTVQVEGTLIQFLFRNPHSFVHLNVKEKDGTEVRYSIEWGGAGQLQGQGVTRETLKIGDFVKISGNPARNTKDHRIRMLFLERPKDGYSYGRRPGETFD